MRTYKLSLALWGAVCLVISNPSVYAGTILADVNDSLYLDLAAQPEYDPVGSIYWTETGGSFIGSGTYIGDGWVLTAAHVADGTDFLGGDNSNWRFTVGGSTYYADEYYIHPDWTASSGNLVAGVDLALVKLETDITNVDPAIIYDMTDEDAYLATLVGFGSTGTGETGYTSNSYGTKRAGVNEIADFDETAGDRSLRRYSDTIMFTDFDNPDSTSDNRWGSSDPLDLEYMTAPGDSGGGLFIEVDGISYLAGVTSFGIAFDDEVDADYGDGGGYIRTSQFIDWIEDISGIAAGAIETIPLVGDFNLDGIVDGLDLMLWQDTLGDLVNPGTGADANGDGMITAEDYMLWLDNYEGNLTGNLVTGIVPEPSAICLFLLAGASLAMLRSRQQ